MSPGNRTLPKGKTPFMGVDAILGKELGTSQIIKKT